MIAQLDMQDLLALTLALGGLVSAWWLHKRFAKPSGCGRCPMSQPDDREA